MRLSRRAARTAGRAGLLVLVASPAPAAAQDAFELDEPPETDRPITRALSYGIELGLDALRAENLDLDHPGADLTQLEPTLDLALTWTPVPRLRAFLDLEFAHFYERIAGDGSQTTSLRAKEAYVTLLEAAPGLALQGGRLPFEDPLRWLYDEELDGARAIWRAGDVALDAAVSRLRAVDLDVFQDEPGDDATNLFLTARRRVGEDFSGSAYALHRADLESTEDLTWLGVQAVGEVFELDLRLDAAWVGGEAREDGEAQDVSGFGADLALTAEFDLPLEPTLTLGLAFGSGDDGGGDGDDRAFRQTGLHGNEVLFGGLTRIATYGEVLAPELSNLWVWTVGGGLRPSEASSIDLVWHLFRQDEPADELRDSGLEVEPSGADWDLGHEVDLVIGYAGVEDLEAEVTLGAFFPGAAFSRGRAAWLVALELVCEF